MDLSFIKDCSSVQEVLKLAAEKGIGLNEEQARELLNQQAQPTAKTGT